MIQFKSSAQLKALAKEQLYGNYTTAIISLCIIIFISFTVSFFIELSFNTLFFSSAILYYLITSVFQIFMGIFFVGSARLYLNIACRRSPSITDIFYGFTHHTMKAILCSLFYFLASMISMVPFFILIFFASFTSSILLILLAFFSLIVGSIGLVIFNLTFSQSYYIMVDLPNYSILEVMKTSATIMKGHRLQLFYLEMSFIGVALLGLVTCFIGLLWVSPYIQATTTNFYLELMKLQTTNPEDNF